MFERSLRSTAQPGCESPRSLQVRQIAGKAGVYEGVPQYKALRPGSLQRETKSSAPSYMRGTIVSRASRQPKPKPKSFRSPRSPTKDGRAVAFGSGSPARGITQKHAALHRSRSVIEDPIGQSAQQAKALRRLQDLAASADRPSAFSAGTTVRTDAIASIMLDKLGQIRHRIRARAYCNGGVDMRREFKSMDLQDKGYLEYNEFSQYIRRLVPLDEEEVKQLLRVVDANSDGTIVYRELAEFVGADISSPEDEEKSTPQCRIDYARYAHGSSHDDDGASKSLLEAAELEVRRLSKLSEQRLITIAAKEETQKQLAAGVKTLHAALTESRSELDHTAAALKASESEVKRLQGRLAAERDDGLEAAATIGQLRIDVSKLMQRAALVKQVAELRQKLDGEKKKSATEAEILNAEENNVQQENELAALRKWKTESIDREAELHRTLKHDGCRLAAEKKGAEQLRLVKATLEKLAEAQRRQLADKTRNLASAEGDVEHARQREEDLETQVTDLRHELSEVLHLACSVQKLAGSLTS